MIFHILEICLGWTLLSVGLTALAWGLEIIPEDMKTLPMTPFFLLANHKFVTLIGIPFLVIFGVVITCDVIVLVIALLRKRDLLTPITSSDGSGAGMMRRSISVSRGSSSRICRDASVESGEEDHKRTIQELQLTIRCLSLTAVYLLSELCVFLPGVILFGCDLKSNVS